MFLFRDSHVNKIYLFFEGLTAFHKITNNFMESIAFYSHQSFKLLSALQWNISHILTFIEHLMHLGYWKAQKYIFLLRWCWTNWRKVVSVPRRSQPGFRRMCTTPCRPYHYIRSAVAAVRPVPLLPTQCRAISATGPVQWFHTHRFLTAIC